MEDQKPWPVFACNQDFAKRRGLEPKMKMAKLGNVLSKLVQLKSITDGINFLKKIAILMPSDHISHVFRAI